jgi:hypothetical protein
VLEDFFSAPAVSPDASLGIFRIAGRLPAFALEFLDGELPHGIT